MAKSNLLPVGRPVDIRAKARNLTVELRGECSVAISRIEAVVDQIAELGPMDPEPPRPDDSPSVAELAREWLDRQRLLGLITPEGAAAVEKLIAEVG